MKPRTAMTRLAFPLLLLLAGCADQAIFAVPHASDAPAEVTAAPVGLQPDTLSVMTLNLAHGRGTGFHQVLQSSQTTTFNLDKVGDLIDRHGVQLVALQEADSESFWSGRFDHVDYLAETQRFDWSAHASHVTYPGLDYGTAILSRLPLNDSLSVRFSPGSGSLPKGFVVSTLPWPNRAGLKVTVVSLHLDPARRNVRAAQINELRIVLAQRAGPFIVMGDFNTEWNQRHSAVRAISEDLGLAAFEPEAPMTTFPANRKRLDWILISDELEFEYYQVIDDAVSDHRAVVARIAWPKRTDTG